jgi:hypothetical protein
MKKAAIANLRWAFVVSLAIAGCEKKPNTATQDGASLPTASSSNPNVQDVTFAQITDTHLFDAGNKRHGQAIYEEALDNRAALHWGILEINRIDATVRRVDFVVFTGDWGLENVHLPGDPPQQRKCKCPRPPGLNEGPVPAIALDSAVNEVANELQALVVTSVFLVPGNNDICEGDPRDLHRYAEFVLKLQERLPGRVTDLTHSAELLNARGDARLADFIKANGPSSVVVGIPPEPASDEVQGVHLLGMNSASFEQRFKYSLVGPDAPGHPGYELGRAETAIKNGQSYLIFTHMPDLKDPAPRPPRSGSVTSAKDTMSNPVAANQPAWDLDSRDLQAWEDKVVARTEVLGIFAGHLHSSDRSIYSAASEKHPLATRTSVAAKTWVAPPMAVKDQFAPPDGRTARGFLLATITGTGATSVRPYWYVTLDQNAASEGDATLAEAHAEAQEGNWDNASQKYAEAMKSSDSRVRASASLGYVDARAVMRTWWWQIGKFFPPLRWMIIHPVRTVLVIGALLAFLGLFRPLRWIWEGVFRVLRALLMSRFGGSALVLIPKKLTETTNAELFASELSHGSRDVADVLEWDGLNIFAGTDTLLTLPSELTETLIKALPEEIGSVKIRTIAEVLLAIVRYFGWRVESQVGFCPTTPAAPGGAAGPSGEMRAFATLRWAWITKENWSLARPARDANDVSETAYALAARILWETFAYE